MIYSHTHKFIYVSIPKCGTHTFYHVFQEYYNAERWGRFHELDLPDFDTSDYYIFTSCRNPYDRLVSAWWTTCVVNKRFTCGSLGFVDFVPWVFEHNPEYAAISPQYTYVSNFKLDGVIRLERAWDDFSKLPFFHNQIDSLPKIHSQKT